VQGQQLHSHIALLNAARGRFIEYLLERRDVRDIWKNYTQHQFVQEMAKATLPIELFKSYLIQDYLYLVSRPTCADDEPHPSADSLCEDERTGSIQEHINGFDISGTSTRNGECV
jgi:TENA/THI-4/PQQC family